MSQNGWLVSTELEGELNSHAKSGTPIREPDKHVRTDGGVRRRLVTYYTDKFQRI